jgi:hypothetical protein
LRGRIKVCLKKSQGQAEDGKQVKERQQLEEGPFLMWRFSVPVLISSYPREKEAGLGDLGTLITLLPQRSS